MTSRNDIIIETKNLTKTFPLNSSWKKLFTKDTRTALHDVSLQVHRGELMGLLGPNGAGKTTIQKILATLVHPTSGTATVDGLDVVQHSTEVRSRIGFVYGDERSFYWRLSVRENLRFYAALYGLEGDLALKKIDDLIDKVGLSSSANIRMHYFSMGMKQRAAIARGLLGEPNIIFMDEPTRALDPVGTFEIHKIIREQLMGDGKHTILLATNNMGEAEALCDRVMLLNQGEIQLLGTIPQLQASLGAGRTFTIEAGASAAALSSLLEEIEGVLSVETIPCDIDRVTVTLHVTSGGRAIPEALRLLANHDVDVWRCTEEVAGLSDLFRQAVRPKPRPIEAVVTQ